MDWYSILPKMSLASPFGAKVVIWIQGNSGPSEMMTVEPMLQLKNCIARSTRRRCKELLHCIYLLLQLHIEPLHILPFIMASLDALFVLGASGLARMMGLQKGLRLCTSWSMGPTALKLGRYREALVLKRGCQSLDAKIRHPNGGHFSPLKKGHRMKSPNPDHDRKSLLPLYDP